MTVREQRGVAAGLGGPVDDAPGRRRDAVEELAAGRARPHGPSGTLLADLRRGTSFVLAVIPLLEVVVGLDPVAVAGEAARLDRARERGGQHGRERAAGEDTADRRGLLAPGRAQRHVAAAGVLAGRRPLGLAVADEPQLARPPRPAHGAPPASGR